MRGTIKKNTKIDKKTGKETYTYEYLVYVGIDEKTGKRIYKRKRGFTKKTDCEDALRTLVNSVKNGSYLIDTEKLDVKTYLDYWLENYVKKNCAPSTIRRYKIYVSDMICKYIGTIQLNKVTIASIEKLYNDLHDIDSYNPRTINAMGSTLHGAFRHAIKWKFINSNPCDNADKLKLQKKQVNFWEAEKIPQYLKKLENTCIYNFVFLAVYTGLRYGELKALKWSDIDFTSGTLTVKRSMYFDDDSKETKVKSPKTEQGYRTIVLLPVVLDFLKKLKTSQKIIDINNFILINEETKNKYSISMSTKLKKTLEKLDIPVIRFHDLRHSYASMLLYYGVNIKTISSMLGHSDISTTMNVYSHVDLELQKREMEKLALKIK